MVNTITVTRIPTTRNDVFNRLSQSGAFFSGTPGTSTTTSSGITITNKDAGQRTYTIPSPSIQQIPIGGLQRPQAIKINTSQQTAQQYFSGQPVQNSVMAKLMPQPVQQPQQTNTLTAYVNKNNIVGFKNPNTQQTILTRQQPKNFFEKNMPMLFYDMSMLRNNVMRNIQPITKPIVNTTIGMFKPKRSSPERFYQIFQSNLDNEAKNKI